MEIERVVLGTHVIIGLYSSKKDFLFFIDFDNVKTSDFISVSLLCYFSIYLYDV